MRKTQSTFQCDRCKLTEVVDGAYQLPVDWESLGAFIRFHGANQELRDVLKSGDFCPTCCVAIKQNFLNVDLLKP